MWSKAEYVDKMRRTLARKHGLAIYDPQSGHGQLSGFTQIRVTFDCDFRIMHKDSGMQS